MSIITGGIGVAVHRLEIVFCSFVVAKLEALVIVRWDHGLESLGHWCILVLHSYNCKSGSHKN